MIAGACDLLRIPYHQVSFGQTPELTSKCIKAVEAADSIGFLAEALECCAQGGWQPTPKASQLCNARAPLHVVFALDVPLREFVVRPEAAHMLVDTFRGSHHSYCKAALSLLDTEGAALSIHNRDMDRILREKEAILCLRELLPHARRAGLAQVLRDEHERSCRGAQGPLYVLQMDEMAAPL